MGWASTDTKNSTSCLYDLHSVAISEGVEFISYTGYNYDFKA